MCFYYLPAFATAIAARPWRTPFAELSRGFRAWRFGFRGGVPHMNPNTKSLHGGFWCCSSGRLHSDHGLLMSFTFFETETKCVLNGCSSHLAARRWNSYCQNKRIVFFVLNWKKLIANDSYLLVLQNHSFCWSNLLFFIANPLICLTYHDFCPGSSPKSLSLTFPEASWPPNVGIRISNSYTKKPWIWQPQACFRPQQMVPINVRPPSTWCLLV